MNLKTIGGMELNQIYNSDCLAVMDSFSKDGVCVDIVITSPPYNTGRDIKSQRARDNHEGRYDVYSENVPNADYDNFIVSVFEGFDRILKQNGVVLWNVSYGNENPTQMWTTVSRVCERTNFMISDCIVWKKSSALPNNVSHNKLTRICEFVFVFCRKDEYMTYFMNKQRAGISKKGQATYRNMMNIIEAPNNDGVNPLNKATFSSSLVYKLLSMYAKNGMVVFDPFMGTGTTAIGAIKYGCDFLGSELSESQCKYAMNRISKEMSQLTLNFLK